MRLWRFGILRALVHRVLKDGNFDIPAKKKTDKTRLSLTTVKRPEMKDVLKETGKLIKVNICFDQVKLMRNNHKLVLCFCFLKAVCLVPDLYNYFQSNMDRVLLIVTECH